MNRIIRLFLIVVVILGAIGVQKNVYAATIGSVLPSPEAGWQRLDDNTTNVQYIGSGWSTLTRNESYYGGTRHNSSKYSLGDTIKIVFKGTKIRLISSAYPQYSNDMRVTIDGVEEKYSQYAPYDTNKVVTYEKLDLENKVHYVEVSKRTAGTYGVDLTLDAIDIDGDGTFLDPGYTEPQPTPTVTPEPTVEPTPTVTPSPTPEQPTGDRAILVVTINTGLEKEFDLSMEEVNSFITWYENKQAGTGRASYAIDKHDNNKGPFTSRKDYVIFDKILTFSVDEYSAK